MMNRRYKEQVDIEFMQPVIAASRRKEDRFAPFLLFTSLLAFISFITWAWLAEIDEVTRAEGRVIPSSQIKRVNHLEGGIIKEILVREGEIVNKGQVLIRMDNTVADAKLNENRELYFRYLTAVERLRAQTQGKAFEVPAIVKEKAPEIGAQETIRFDARKEKLNNELGIAHHEIEQKQQEILEFQTKRDQLEDQYRLAQEELKINAPLAAKGLTSKVDFLRLQREEAEIKGQLAGAKVSIVKAESALRETKEKLAQIPVLFRGEDLNELRDAENKLATVQGLYRTEGDRLQRTEVRSPVKGVIKQLLQSTLGSVVRPSEDVIEIVPLEDSLLIEAQVLPADVAFLKPGLPATIKLTAYDFSLYGGLKAELIEISADTIQDRDKQNRSFFRVRLRTLGSLLSKSHKYLAIMPGMTATVDIITGKKSVLDYLLKPILKTKQNAFTER